MADIARTPGTLRRAVGELRGVRRSYAVAIAVAIAEVVAALAFPLAQRVFFDDVLIAGDYHRAAGAVVTMTLCAVAMLAAHAVSRVCFARVANTIALRVRAEVVAAIHLRPLDGARPDSVVPAGAAGVETTGNGAAGSAAGDAVGETTGVAAEPLSTGAAVAAATTDVETMAELYQSVIGVGLVSVLRLVGIVGVLAVIDPALLFIAVPVIATYAVVPAVMTGRLRRAAEREQHSRADLTALLQEGFAARRDVAVFGRTSWVVRRQQRAGQVLADSRLRRVRLESLTLMAEVVYWVTVAAICWYGATQVAAGAITVGTLIALIQYVGRLEEPIGALAAANVRMQSGLAAADRVYAQLDAGGPRRADAPEDPPAATPSGLRLTNVCYRHRPDTRCLEGVDVHIDAGQVVALIGATGVGKSTLVDVIIGRRQAAAGIVAVGDRDVTDCGVDERNDVIALSAADGLLFDGSIAENIRFGRLGASDAEIRDAAVLAGVDEFASTVPGGLDAAVGERGELLSTGQRQRVLLARALIRRPAVLLLDEATAGLDHDAERRFLERLAAAPHRPATLLITHRQSSLDHADRVVQLVDGTLRPVDGLRRAG